MRRTYIFLLIMILLASIHSIHAEAPEPGTGFATAPLLKDGVYDYHLAIGESTASRFGWKPVNLSI